MDAQPKFFQDPATAAPLPSDLATIEVPTMFTKASHSPRFFHASVDRVAATMPNATVRTIDGAAQAAMLEQPNDCASAIHAFLRGAAST